MIPPPNRFLKEIIDKSRISVSENLNYAKGSKSKSEKAEHAETLFELTISSHAFAFLVE